VSVMSIYVEYLAASYTPLSSPASRALRAARGMGPRSETP
jgi:hypothetical protein